MIVDADKTPVTACMVSGDSARYGQLVAELEQVMGDRYSDLGFVGAQTLLDGPDAERPDVITLAVDGKDQPRLEAICSVISSARARSVPVIVVAGDLGPTDLHHLLRSGADEFLPYPMPQGELGAAIDRLTAPPQPDVSAAPPARQDSRDGALIAVHGLAGGTGATTLAVNLGWELAGLAKDDGPRVCLLDLDLQFGSVATYLDLPRREAVYEMLSDTDRMDGDVFAQALRIAGDRLHVLTAPADLLPLDLITPEDVARLIAIARSRFDYVIVDMPKAFVNWSETVLQAAHVYLCMIELNLRSAQNALRVKRALQSEDLPFDNLRFVLNRAPKFTDLGGKARVRRLAESLGISIDLSLPDGGKPVTHCGDHGQPLAAGARKNPLRREIAKLATSLHDLGRQPADRAA